MGEGERCLKDNFGKFGCVNDYVTPRFTTLGRSTVNRLFFKDVGFRIWFLLNVILSPGDLALGLHVWFLRTGV